MSLKGALIVSLLVQTVTAVSQNMSLPPMPDYSMTFPPLPQDFKEMAKKLMTRCSKNGYSPPNVTDYFLNSSAMPEQKIGNPIFLFPPLLSSLPPLSVNRAALPPDMSKPPEQDPAMNITKKMLNSTNLPQMIEFMRNTTEKDHCFMRAFLAPLCWASALQNSSQLSPGQLGNLLWAAKPFLEAAPPAALSLPSRVQSAHLVEMMKLFSEMFSSLSEQHRDEIKRWMKERVTENEPLCQPVQNISSTFTPNPPKPSAMTKLEPITDNQGLLSLHVYIQNAISENKLTNTSVRKTLFIVLVAISENETGLTNGVTSGDKAPNRARRGLGQGNLKVTQPPKIVENPVKAEIPVNSQNPDKPSEVPVNQQNPNKPAEIPGNQQNPNKPSEISGSQQNPNKPSEISGSQQNPNKPSEISGSQQNPNKPSEISGSQQNPNKPAEIPGSQQNSNNPAEIPGSQQNSNKPAENPGSQQNSNKPAENPGSQQNSNKPAEVPGSQQNSNKPAENPGSQQNSNKPAEVPGSQQNPIMNQTKNPGANNDILPQTPGNSDKTVKELSNVEVTEQVNKKETVNEMVVQNPGKQNDSGKQIDVGNGKGNGNGNGKNENKENMAPEDPSAAKEEKETGKDGQKQQGECNADDGGKNKSNSPPPGCPRMPWLKAEALRMMGRFFSQLPEVEVKAIPTEELCKFFVTPEFPSSFGKADGMQPAISRMLFQRLKQECSNSSQNFLNHIDRLGSLICFFDDGPSLNATLSKKLLSQMADCENVGIDQIKRDLMRKVMSNGDVPPTIELLRTLGSSVSILPPSKLSDFSADTLKDGLSSLREVKWKPAQARILAQKLLEKNITGESLLSLGSMVRGVDSEILRKVKLQGLLGNEGLKNMTEKMSSLQKKALLEGLRSSLNESDLVKKVPDSLLSSLSLLSLEKAGISSVDQLQGHSWSRTQSVYLVKKMLGQGIKSEQIRKLGQAVQGVTCSMIDSVNQSDTLTTVQTLANSSNWLSRTQVRCIANKLFLSLEKQRPDYFMNITSSDLQAVPALLLIQLPIKAIQGLPATVCPRFLEKMSQANLSSLPNSAPSRWELRDRALRCLGKNASNLSTAEVLSLGPLVCELDPAWMSSLNPAALNSTLQALASCEHIPRPYRAPLFTLITRVYGAPSVWTEDVMKLLGPLLLLNDTSLETMPFKSWLKSSLSDLLDSLQPQTAAPRPEEFRSWPDLLALRRKLFQLKTNPILQRRRREISPSVVPSVSAMEDLGEGNMYWSPAQLANMSVQSFREAVHVLGEIRNFTAEQLVELRKKAVEAWGDASLLNQTQIVELGCICQGFNTTELQKLNITSLDTLELLSICNWNYTQKVAIWQGFTERTGIKMAKLGALEMTGLGNFICGLQPDQIDQLSTGEFKEAVEDIGHARCPVTVLECLKRKAISAFGDPKSWGEAEASMMGNIIAGLNGTELASLNSSVLPFIRQSAITLILPERLAAMSVNQLKSLGPDNAAMVTETQRSGLGVEQRAAVNESLGLSTPRSETSTSAPVAVPQKGGAPQQSVLGIAVLPVVLLLLGFLL